MILAKLPRKSLKPEKLRMLERYFETNCLPPATFVNWLTAANATSSASWNEFELVFERWGEEHCESKFWIPATLADATPPGSAANTHCRSCSWGGVTRKVDLNYYEIQACIWRKSPFMDAHLNNCRCAWAGIDQRVPCVECAGRVLANENQVRGN